jgi:hypothetical protein
MALTFGTTGMDSATESELHAAFQLANAQTGGHWQLLGENDADYVVVDMDSMYGPMSWLRLHAAGKQVIGLTSAPRTQTDYRLTRPLTSEGLVALLTEIAAGNGMAPATTPAPDVAAPIEQAAAVQPVPEQPMPAGMSAAPMPQDQLPEEHPQAVDEEAEPPSPAPALPGSVEAGTLAPTTIQPTARPPGPAPTPPVPPPAPPRPLGLADWLATGQLPGRMRYRRNAGPTLLIDPVTRQFHGPAALKSLAGYFEGEVAESDFEPADAGTWTREAAALGPAQPLARLQWYAGLLAGKGSLLPGYDAAGLFKLGKWPQTEREFPKHFRIATAMMKGPATLDDIAAASGVPRDEVIDFVNASLATGFAEPYLEPEPEPEPQKPGGLFGRLRGK